MIQQIDIDGQAPQRRQSVPGWALPSISFPILAISFLVWGNRALAKHLPPCGRYFSANRPQLGPISRETWRLQTGRRTRSVGVGNTTCVIWQDHMRNLVVLVHPQIMFETNFLC